MVNCLYKGDGTMIKRTYEIWQISAETILANAKQREDGTYRIHFDVEKAVHNESVRKTEQPQCASNIIGVTRLAFPAQLVEITFRAVVSSDLG